MTQATGTVWEPTAWHHVQDLRGRRCTTALTVKMGNKAPVDRLDDQNGSKAVARLVPAADRVAASADGISGEPWWDRTTDPLIKSQVLCQLS